MYWCVVAVGVGAGTGKNFIKEGEDWARAVQGGGEPQPPTCVRASRACIYLSLACIYRSYPRNNTARRGVLGSQEEPCRTTLERSSYS